MATTLEPAPEVIEAPAEPERPGQSSAWPHRTLQLLVLAAPVVAVVVGAWSRRWTSDDGFINYRVVDQVMAGNGPVFNAGERVELATSPLWLWVLLGLRATLGWAVDQAWLGVVAGIAAAGGAVALAEMGARWLWPAPVLRRSLIVPVGVLVLVAVPAFWEFATSGLELGLAYLWLAGCFAGLARRSRAGGGGPATKVGQRLDWLAVAIGLGPLVRPEFALYSLAFAVALLWGRPGRRVQLVTLAQVLVVPVTYQVFRMGYYATLVPNTALAKSAGEANWEQGWFYLRDYTSSYWLWAPMLVVAGLWVLVARASTPSGRRLLGLLLAATALHVVYVVRLGGDFMHARFLLVPTLALCLPVAVVPVAGDRLGVPARVRVRPLGRALAVAPLLGFAVMLAWAVPTWRNLVPEDALYAVEHPLGGGRFRNRGVIDERRFWMAESEHDHPVTLDDYREDERWQVGDRLRRAQARGEDLAYPHPADAVPGPGVSALWGNIGITGSSAGVDVHIYDAFSLADPVGSRLTTDGSQTRPGHEKLLPPAWAEARALRPAPDEDPDVAAARRALSCPALQDLDRDLTAALTPARFLANLWQSVPNTALEIPADPETAARELC